ncbi:ABC transporter ATP-binding protein [Arcanobacterium buesumense]|uniref:ABC transporter ATP-binding protein n=1 Tax=Arcanobacterium buesumense TaxID=2722751 RepID=A0A6H2EJT6_9ACTO|nr:ABC transporter ATP-binding protein [Arcanobacterium buesumense]QJC21109.1 ABC transporter ATP-binding protein [Arcanobacterium buesumense]
MTSKPLLSIEDLHVTIKLRKGQVEPLRGVNLEVMPGETLGIVGESGCGKTMTALSVMGLLPHMGSVSGGKLTFQGRNLLDLSDKDARRVRGMEIGMIFQDPLTSLNPTMKIGDQVAEPLRVHRGVSKAEGRQAAIDVLRKVGMPRPEAIVNDYPHQLSGGMRQRVMIAMALICQPALLIADEPTTALDVTIQRQILDLLDELKKEFDTSVILVTHDLGVVAGRADRVAVMYAGRVVEVGTTDEIFTNPQHQYTRSLMAALPENTKDTRQELYAIPGMPPSLREEIVGCPFAPRCPRALDVCHSDTPELVTVTDKDGQVHSHACWNPAGPELERPISIREKRDLTQRPVICSVQSLSKLYPAMGGKIVRRRIGSVHAVSDVSLDVYEGETLGIVGESGCGKSTLGRVITALEPASEGHVLIGGKDIAQASRRDLKKIRRDVQMMFQDSFAAMDPRMRVDEILTEPLKIQKIGNREDQQDRANTLVGKIGIEHGAMWKYPHEFSGGQLQRIGLARSLVLEPKLIVCDEPVSALDVSVQAQVLNVMRRLQEEQSLTYIFISHDLSVVKYISDRIAVMYLGKIVEIGPAAEIVDNPRHPYTQALIEAIPVADPRHKRKEIVHLTGEPASAINPPEGCRFKNRCPFATELCNTEPVLVGGGRQVACHYPLG